MKVIDHFLPQPVLFVVPTKALVQQQAKYCREHSDRDVQVAELCGLEPRRHRTEPWWLRRWTAGTRCAGKAVYSSIPSL